MTAAISSDASLSDGSATASASSASITPSVTTVASLVPLTNAKALAQTSPEASATSTTATTTKAADEGGLPQLRTEYWGGQIAWLLIIFVVFYILMAKVFAPRIRKIIETRGSTIAEDLANARANRDEAEVQAKQAEAETAAAHVAARKLAAESIARSNAEIAAQQAAEDTKLNARLNEAETRIRAARDGAMSHVKDIASETASAIITKLTGKAPTATALKAAFGKVGS